MRTSREYEDHERPHGVSSSEPGTPIPPPRTLDDVLDEIAMREDGEDGEDDDIFREEYDED
jgi:hypothetical protein